MIQELLNVKHSQVAATLKAIDSTRLQH